MTPAGLRPSAGLDEPTRADVALDENANALSTYPCFANTVTEYAYSSPFARRIVDTKVSCLCAAPYSNTLTLKELGHMLPYDRVGGDHGCFLG